MSDLKRDDKRSSQLPDEVEDINAAPVQKDAPVQEDEVEDEFFHLRDYDTIGGIIRVPSKDWKVIPHKPK